MNNLDIEWTRVTEVLQRYAEEFIKEARANLGVNNSYASGSLGDTMKPLIEIGENEFKVSIYLNDYWVYVENGRRAGAKMPPISAIKEWIEIKPIVPEDRGYGIPTTEQLAFLIARSIGENGIEPRPFFEKAKETVYNRFENDIAYAVSEDIAAYVENVLLMYYNMLKGL